MGKVLRLHDGVEGIGWFDSTQIGDTQLDTILTDGKDVANSIPSPFARIELVNDAFKWVAKNGIAGKTAQHKLVSEALDVGQLMYSIRKYSDKLKIVDYNIEDRIKSDFDGAKADHKAIAKTFNTFLDQDGDLMGFGADSTLYFLFNRSELIGATSPCSLFMSAPVTRKFRDSISAEGSHGQFFSEKAYSLLDREWGFVEYLFALSKMGGFAGQFTSFFSYLEKVKDEMNSDQRELISALNYQYFESRGHEQLYVSNSPSNKVEVQNYRLWVAPVNTGSIAQYSDFIIQADFETGNKPPLVLPNDDFSDRWVYTTPDVIWNKENFRSKIPYKNELPISDSKLPVQNDSYPWLSAGNFFTDTILQLPYKSDETNFETADSLAGYTVASNYLLPLSDTYFEYFKTDKIKSSLKLREFGQGSVEAQLIIKVKKGDIVFKKTYTKEHIFTAEINLAILPFVRLVGSYPKRYTVGFYDADLLNNINDNYSIVFYESRNPVKPQSVVTRSEGDKRTRTAYYRLAETFDKIRITYKDKYYGYIVPKMPEYKPSADECAFSIDFGTTNTHIEYKLNNNAEKAFDTVSESDFWVSLLPKAEAIDSDEIIAKSLGIIAKEVFPGLIGGQSVTRFPLRTAITENADIDFSRPIEVYGHINTYLLFHNTSPLDYQRPRTDLKWENLHLDENNKRLKAYFENTILLIYYKVIALKIPFNRLSLMWFFPTSMGMSHRNQMNQTWKDCVKEVFGDAIPETSLKDIPESIGPYFYHYKREALSGLSVSIDIGGGSTDISVYDQNRMLLISSFRFAGNDLFGDGYGRNPEKNGFIKTFGKEAENYLRNYDTEGDRILKSIIEDTESSHEFSSYLFSLEPGFKYADKIYNNPNIKLTVVIFHAAILFYVANLLKLKELGTPNNILYSGTAAKTLKIIDPGINTKTAVTTGLVSHIMGAVFKKDDEHNISCQLSDHPKEITCKGGLLATHVEGLTNEQTIWLGGQKVLNKLQLERSNEMQSVSDIEDIKKQDIVKSVEVFYNILDDYFSKVDINNEYGINKSAYKKFQEVQLLDAKGSLETGLTRLKEQSGADDNLNVEESLFFYPLKQELTKIAYELSKIKIE